MVIEMGAVNADVCEYEYVALLLARSNVAQESASRQSTADSPLAPNRWESTEKRVEREWESERVTTNCSRAGHGVRRRVRGEEGCP